MPFRAFVSSTFVDLEPHRKVVIEALRDGGFDVDPMEHWTSAAQEPKVLSVDRLEGCHVCILLVARRRGHVPSGERFSITQMEYEEARRRGIDILPFLLDEAETQWPAEWDQLAQDADLRSWREALSERHVAPRFRRDPGSLKIAAALTRWVQQDGPRTALRQYLAAVQADHGEIRFLDLPRLQDMPHVRLDRLFVEPGLSPRWIPLESEDGAKAGTASPLEALASGEPLVVLGDPGSGKSTLVSWIAWQLARQHQTPAGGDWVQRLGGAVPLPLVLRDLKLRPGLGWDEVMSLFLATPHGRMLTAENLRRLLADGKVLWLLDGLDEVSNPTLLQDLRDAVYDGMQRHPGCRWLFTSRIVGYDDVRFHRSPPLDARHVPGVADVSIGLRYVAPFDAARIARFAQGWFALRESVERRARQLAEEFVAAVRGDVATSRLAGVPNLLTMMALIFRVRARLPHGRALLYNEIAQAYLETIDYHRQLPQPGEPYIERRSWLARVAFEMQHRRAAKAGAGRVAGANEFYASGEDVREWLAQAMRESSPASSDQDAEAFVDYLGRRAGLLLPRGEDRFAFMHLSFQEYFAALYLHDQIVSPGWLRGSGPADPRAARAALKAYAASAAWSETLVFLVEVFAAEKSRWIVELLDGLFGEALGDLDPRHEIAAMARWRDGARRLLRRGREIDARRESGMQRATLLARLAFNPHAGLDDAGRAAAVERCSFWAALDSPPSGSYALQSRRESLFDLLRAAGALAPGMPLQRFCAQARVGGLRKLNLRGLAGLADLSPLRPLKHLEMLDVSRTEVRELAALADLRRLRQLEVDQTDVADLGPLSALTELHELDAHTTPVGDLRPLARLRSLKQLQLQRTNVQDLSPVRGLPELEALNVGFSGCADLGPLTGHTGLRRLEVDGIEDIDLQVLGTMPGLRDLWAMFVQVPDWSFLGQLRSLRFLALGGTNLEDLGGVAAMSELKTLFAGSTQVHDLRPLAALKLEVLKLDETPVADLSPLAGMVALRDLSVEGTDVSDLSPLLDRSDTLTSLNIQRTAVDGEHLAWFMDQWRRRTTRNLNVQSTSP